MYSVTKYRIRKSQYPGLFEYCSLMSARCKDLRNAALFRLRQWFTAFKSDHIHPLQKEVIDEVLMTCAKSGRKKPGRLMSYYFLEKLMRCTENPDFFNGLPAQTAQWVLKNAVNDFKGWLKALEVYYIDPSAFTGRPEIPRYCKKDLHSFTITNQECKIYQRDDGTMYLHFPKTKETLNMHMPENAVLKEVKVIPYYGDFLISVTFEYEKSVSEINAVHIAGIDLGVDKSLLDPRFDFVEPGKFRRKIILDPNVDGEILSKVHALQKRKGRINGMTQEKYDELAAIKREKEENYAHEGYEREEAYAQRYRDMVACGK